MLAELADLDLDKKQTERVTEGIGQERLVERAACVAAYQELPLVEKFAVPAGVTAPELAVVMVDGGRLQILERSPPPAPDSAGVADGWEEETATNRKGHWREDKVGLLLSMKSAVASSDPCPEVPPSFVDVVRLPKLVRELQKNVKQAADAVAAAKDPAAQEQALQEATCYEPPGVLQRQVLASRDRWPSFAVQVAAQAQQRGFQGATRKAFVADGSVNNWTLQRRFFGSFVPILDFIHALSYVFAAAMTGRSFALGWEAYRQWICWVWQGQVSQVIAALGKRQEELGPPEPDEPDSSPRVVVEQTLGYLRHHQDKMAYDQYRRQGLPLTSSLMESAVKQVNQRVKGTEKFWSEAGAEALLQLRADHLSDGEPLAAFWERRQENATGQRRYSRAG